jgi:hypothetical protein
MFENRGLRRIFGPKREEGTDEWRRLHIEDLSDLYSSPNIIRVACSTYGGEQKCTQRSGGETLGKEPLGRPRGRWEDKIKMDLREAGMGAWTGLIWFRIGTGGGLL